MANAATLYDLLKRPIVSEKTTQLAEIGQYVFEVRKDANKVELSKAFELAFPGRKVNAVRLIKIPPRDKRVGRRVGKTPERLKAVFSITGDPIELFTEV
ncbi:MAG: 50S ribosomal protein L23 [Cyanobacteria bacterium]|nr:50S ribosomal protein L23 [Cyanobacteriota bacterium]